MKLKRSVGLTLLNFKITIKLLQSRSVSLAEEETHRSMEKN